MNFRTRTRYKGVMGRRSNSGPFERISGLEVVVQARLDDPAAQGRISAQARSAAREWSRAVWAHAQALGPTPLAPAEIARGLALARQPVFVCGVARSGTTLLRDLLDSHQQLAVIPTESLFYTDLEPALFKRPSVRHNAFLAAEWLERLVFPPPRWLLGRSSANRSPYVDFARDLAAWWQLPAGHREARNPSWPLAALALAVARHLGGGPISPATRLWVEKSLTSERFLDRIWNDFPQAKVLHIVRDPAAVLASLKALEGDRWRYRKAASTAVRFMVPSYRIAAHREKLPADRYRLVRYEALAERRETELIGIAKFLEIDPSPTLANPTVVGQFAASNSSFGQARPDLRRMLDPIERALLALSVGRFARKLGYR